MNQVHFTLQGKGGVGKTVISWIIAQWIIENQLGKNIVLIDTDQVNASLYGFKGLNVQRFIFMENNKINERKFDDLIDIFIKAENDNNIFIVDNGSSSFVPVYDYMLSHNIIDLLTNEETAQTMGTRTCEFIIHCVLNAGVALEATINELVQIIENFQAPVKIVIWLNQNNGQLNKFEGRNIEDLKAIKNNSQIIGILRTPIWQANTFAIDMKNMFERKQTFDQAMNDASLPIMERQRIRQAKKILFDQVNLIAPYIGA